MKEKVYDCCVDQHDFGLQDKENHLSQLTEWSLVLAEKSGLKLEIPLKVKIRFYIPTLLRCNSTIFFTALFFNEKCLTYKV